MSKNKINLQDSDLNIGDVSNASVKSESVNRGSLIRNSILCPDGTFLESRTVHDYQEHTQEDGRLYSVDGGKEYQAINHSDTEYTNLAIYSDDPHEVVRKNFYWGTRGINNDQPLKYIPLNSMEDSHIESIINLKFTSGRFLQYMKDELSFRDENTDYIKR